MSEGWIVGRKAIITALKVPLQLSDDYRTAWNKIMRWRKKCGMDEIFHYQPNGRVYLVEDQVKTWLVKLTEKIR